MMDESKIKYEFPDYEGRCYVCLSIGRKMFHLQEYIGVFRIITSQIQFHEQSILEEIKLCWECQAFLRRASMFIQNVNKANDVWQGQSILYSTQSNLTTVILNDSHTHTIYINDVHIDIPSDTKASDIDDNDGIIDQGDEIDAGDDGGNVDEVVKENTEPRKQKNNRWMKERDLQNKKPKFKIITEYSRDWFQKIEMRSEELHSCLRSERESEYYKSKRFKCCKCVLPFTSEDLLEKHNKKFHNKKALYICDICTASLPSKRQLSLHIRDHYYKYLCKICGFTCYHKTRAKFHCQSLHRKIYQCLNCELKFGNRKEFFKHYKDWHEKFVCDHCGISFKMKYCIEDHIRKQHSPFECKSCNKSFARYNGLWLHNKTVHSERRAAYCVECDRQYCDQLAYRRHLATSARHTQRKKRRIPCPGCDKVFSKNINMRDHYNLVHLKFYKYTCEQCDKNFVRNAELVKHIRRVHEGIRPPKNKICYMCGRGFSTNKILTNHLRTHTGEKPFACTLCNARFAQRTALSAHARAIHHTTDKQT